MKLNLEKSELIPKGDVTDVSTLAAELGFCIGSLPSSYLGLPLGTTHKSMAIWNKIEERTCKKLACWKRNFISKDGRVI